LSAKKIPQTGLKTRGRVLSASADEKFDDSTRNIEPDQNPSDSASQQMMMNLNDLLDDNDEKEDFQTQGEIPSPTICFVQDEIENEHSHSKPRHSSAVNNPLHETTTHIEPGLEKSMRSSNEANKQLKLKKESNSESKANEQIHLNNYDTIFSATNKAAFHPSVQI
jgi:hypothetical protein